MSVPKFLEYLSVEKKYSFKTVQSYERDLKDFLQYYQSQNHSENLHNASKADVRNFLMYLSSTKLTERTINRKLSALKSYYKYLLKIKELNHSPMVGFESLKQNNQLHLPFSEEELKFLFETSTIFPDSFEGRRDRLVLELFYQTGMRRAELINLKLSSVDFNQKNIKIIGKGNKARLLPIGDKLLKMLNAYILERVELFDTERVELFLTKRGKPFYDKLVYNLVNSYLSQVSTKHKKSPHILRHSFATHLLNRGAELNSVKELLGHSSLSATQVYTHSSIKELKKVFNQTHPRSNKIK